MRSVGPAGVMVVQRMSHCHRPANADAAAATASAVVLRTLPEDLVVLLSVAMVHKVVLHELQPSSGRYPERGWKSRKLSSLSLWLSHV